MNEMQKAKEELKNAKINYVKTRNDFRRGFGNGVVDARNGADCGRGSDRWLKSPRAWCEGYEAGWRMLAHRTDDVVEVACLWNRYQSEEC